MEYSVERLEHRHWPAVRAIYEEGISTGQATFETSAPDWERWNGDHLQICRFVMVRGDLVAGWSALSPISGRSVYAGVAEVSIYIAQDHRVQGCGRILLKALIEGSELAGIWTLQTGVFPENDASMALHKACGFRIVGRRERIGQINGLWRDVILLERRSYVV